LAGSFNPLHAGHQEMARIAAARLSRSVWFELAVRNADKSLLDPEQLLSRLGQAFAPHGLICTSAATFVEKSELFPGTVFVVGADTILRVSNQQYYGGSRSRLLDAVARIASAKCRFLVFGRQLGNIFADRRNINILPELLALCDFVERSEFDMKISSTEIRNFTNP
jgi:nicotinic acid mononucleotide adenylyltransferase